MAREDSEGRDVANLFGLIVCAATAFGFWQDSFLAAMWMWAAGMIVGELIDAVRELNK